MNIRKYFLKEEPLEKTHEQKNISLAPEPKREGNYMVLEAIVTNQRGIHARPSALFARTATSYLGEVKLDKLSPLPENANLRSSFNGKSLMGIMSRELGPGSRVKLYVEIYDTASKNPKVEKATLFCKELYLLITSNFDFD